MKTIGGVMKVEGTAFGPAARSAARGVARGRTVRNMTIEKRKPERKIAQTVESSKINGSEGGVVGQGEEGGL